MRLLSAIREIAVSVRDALDGRLHSSRRAEAIERLRRIEPSSVLFVCLGNVCRSPYAERIAEREFPGGVTIDSGGFIGPGRMPPDTALVAASARGIEHADHESKVVGGKELREFDVVFLFDRFNLKHVRSTGSARMDRVFWLGDFDPIWTGKRAIIDPWGRSLKEFMTTFERIERCIETVITHLPAQAKRPESTGGTRGERA